MKQFFDDNPFWARLFVAFVLVLAATVAHGQGGPGQSNYGTGSGGCIATASTAAAKCGTVKGTLISVTDGSTGSDCTSGSGTNVNACIYTGSAYAFAGSSASAPAFSAVTAGTNTVALLMGTPGTLGPGTGTITANAISGSPNATFNALTATTYNGGALSGTFTGAPTLSGNVIFSANPNFTGTPTFANTLALNTSGNAGTATTAANLTGCAGSAAGDICIYNGAAWAKLAGNAVGTKFLQETSSGVGSWAASAGATAWDAITAPSGAMSLTMGANTSTFNTTSAVSQFFAFKNTTAAVVGTSQGSPIFSLCGTAFHASASVEDCLTLSELPGNGNDAAIAFNIGHTGSSTGIVTIQFPGPVAAGASGGGVAGVFSCPEGTAPTGVASSDLFYCDSTAHRMKGINNNGSATTYALFTDGLNVFAAGALASGTTATTQSAKDNSTKVATTAYVDAPTGLTTGTSVSLSAPRQYFVCTSTCTITVPVPAAGYEFCVMNDDNASTVITLSAIGSSARYENTARTAYGTAGTGTFISGGAAADKICLLGRDATHYLTASFNGTWTAN